MLSTGGFKMKQWNQPEVQSLSLQFTRENEEWCYCENSSFLSLGGHPYKPPTQGGSCIKPVTLPADKEVTGGFPTLSTTSPSVPLS